MSAAPALKAKFALTITNGPLKGRRFESEDGRVGTCVSRRCLAALRAGSRGSPTSALGPARALS